jgi:GAF domain-containing protein
MSPEKLSPYELLVEQLHRLILSIEASSYSILPRSNLELLQSIVEAAAKIFGAGASSIALVTPDGKELEFKVAYNSQDQDVVGLRIPINKGIAGYVAMTGQPMAVSNVQQDARFNRDFAEKTGYVPRSILAMPLVSGETVIGVMEILDKLNASSFGLQDMELLAIFANQAAIAIHQSQQIENLSSVLLAGLKKLAVTDLTKSSSELLNVLESQPEANQDLIKLTELIYEISAIGDAERTACLGILNVFRDYSHVKPTTGYW